VRVGGFDTQTRERILEFAHPTFQEYLTAWILWRTMPWHPTPRVLKHLRDADWQEVVLLYLLLLRQQHPTKKVVKSLLQEPGAAGLTLLGRLLGEVELRPFINDDQQAAILTLLRTALRESEMNYTAVDRQVAAAVLQQIAEQEPRAQLILQGALNDDDPLIRIRAADALRGVTDDDAAQAAVSQLLPRTFSLEDGDPNVQVRATMAGTIAVLGDPRLQSRLSTRLRSPSMVTVQATPTEGFRIGLTHDEMERVIGQLRDVSIESNLRQWLLEEESLPGEIISLAPFEIGRYLVTNLEYALYVSVGGRAPGYWLEGVYPADQANHPVTGVSWADAVGYCTWLTETLRDGGTYSLPSEAEWEWVARGQKRRLWPWGDIWIADHCNSRESSLRRICAIGLFPRGASWCGVQDMAGNVWELTTTAYGPYPSDGRETAWQELVEAAKGGLMRNLVLRGGSYIDDAFYCRGSIRTQLISQTLDWEFGFRLARSII
jgi:formylglycine-generating enzyme required for sulfatase activity